MEILVREGSIKIDANDHNVQWMEQRQTGSGPEMFHVWVQRNNGGGWEVFEKSTWEVRWFKIPTDSRIQDIVNRAIFSAGEAHE